MIFADQQETEDGRVLHIKAAQNTLHGRKQGDAAH